jgi:hypothetical protein
VPCRTAKIKCFENPNGLRRGATEGELGGPSNYQGPEWDGAGGMQAALGSAALLVATAIAELGDRLDTTNALLVRFGHMLEATLDDHGVPRGPGLQVAARGPAARRAEEMARAAREGAVLVDDTENGSGGSGGERDADGDEVARAVEDKGLTDVDMDATESDAPV